MPKTGTFVIVGGGLAGARAAQTLREEGFDGGIVVIGDEPERPYERPPLSKGLLTGGAEPDSVYVHEAGWYAAHDVDLRTTARAVAVDRSAARSGSPTASTSGTTSCCWPPAPRPATSRHPASTWTGCCGCVPSPTAAGSPRHWSTARTS
ncbi:FAD-dependent oxidoreductase [Micromonospora fulviviridis]|uniref:FAD-dependent oxidoreductase n=1 Tax=Micromonospora fulviviridis TaxID=47860 RepID=UPI0037B42F7B